MKRPEVFLISLGYVLGREKIEDLDLIVEKEERKGEWKKHVKYEIYVEVGELKYAIKTVTLLKNKNIKKELPEELYKVF